MHTPPASIPGKAQSIIATREQITAAFDRWERLYRDEPASFLTAEESAAMAIASLAEGRAIYLTALLRDTQAAPSTLGTDHESDAEQHLNSAHASLRAALLSAEAAGYGDQFRGSLDEAIKQVEYTQGMLA